MFRISRLMSFHSIHICPFANLCHMPYSSNTQPLSAVFVRIRKTLNVVKPYIISIPCAVHTTLHYYYRWLTRHIIINRVTDVPKILVFPLNCNVYNIYIYKRYMCFEKNNSAELDIRRKQSIEYTSGCVYTYSSRLRYISIVHSRFII